MLGQASKKRLRWAQQHLSNLGPRYILPSPSATCPISSNAHDFRCRRRRPLKTSARENCAWRKLLSGKACARACGVG
eukprot:5023886-Pleurochrysis_carterae.AAC.1